MRPAIKSGLLPVWRDQDTLQIGIDPRRAVALSGMSQAAVLVGLLDGSRDREQVVAAATSLGVPSTATERVLTLLAAGGALDDFPASTLRDVPAPRRARLAAELATVSLAHGDSDGGARSLARRRAGVVRIEGDRRVGRAVGRILIASGVGQVRFGTIRASQAADEQPPCGEQADKRPPTDERERGAGSPGLIVLVGRLPAARTDQLTRDRIPHLALVASEAIAIVGPLVVPGKTACLRCLDYTRAGSDPAWPLILAQIASRRPEPEACGALLASMVAAQAAGQVLCAIDQTPIATAAANGTLELVLPDWQWRRRTWSPHPACACVGNARASHSTS